MNGSILGGLGQGLQNFIQTYTQLHQNELEKKRQAAMDQMNFQSHAATMENQALQRALTQAQLESLPRQQATNEVENILKVQGDQAYNNPNFVSAANRAGMPFQTKQVPLESRNISGTVQGPGLSNIVDKALNMPVSAVKDAAKGSLNMGPMQTKKQLAGDMGVAPDTGIVLPEDARRRLGQADNLQKLITDPNTPPALKNFLQIHETLGDKFGSLPATLFKPEKPDTQPVMRVNPKTGKMEQIGDAPTGAHFVNEPTGNGPRDRFNAVQGVDGNGKPAIIRTNLDTGEVSVLPMPDGAGYKPSAQTAAQGHLAKKVIGHLDAVQTMAQQVDKLGLMGPIGGRWADFAAGKIGDSDMLNILSHDIGRPLSDQEKQLVGRFRSNVGLLKSGMAMVHGGARGGGSPEMAKRMDGLINANRMDINLFLGATEGFRDWLGSYADTSNNSNTPTTPANPNAKPGVKINSITEMK
jgi:hypothetical protein